MNSVNTAYSYILQNNKPAKNYSVDKEKTVEEKAKKEAIKKAEEITSSPKYWIGLLSTLAFWFKGDQIAIDKFPETTKKLSFKLLRTSGVLAVSTVAGFGLGHLVGGFFEKKNNN